MHVTQTGVLVLDKNTGNRVVTRVITSSLFGMGIFLF